MKDYPNLLFDTQGIANTLKNLRSATEITQMSRKLSPMVATLTSSLEEYLAVSIVAAPIPRPEKEKGVHESSGDVNDAALTHVKATEPSFKVTVENLEASPAILTRSEQPETSSATDDVARPLKSGLTTNLHLKRKEPPTSSDTEDTSLRSAPATKKLSSTDSTGKTPISSLPPMAIPKESDNPRSNFLGVYPPPRHGTLRAVSSINSAPETNSQPSVHPEPRVLEASAPTNTFPETPQSIALSQDLSLLTLAKFLASASLLPTVEEQRRALYRHYNARLALLNRDIYANMTEMLCEGKRLVEVFDWQHELVGEELSRFRMATEMFLKVFSNDSTETTSVSPILSELRELVARLRSMVDRGN